MLNKDRHHWLTALHVFYANIFAKFLLNYQPCKLQNILRLTSFFFCDQSLVHDLTVLPIDAAPVRKQNFQPPAAPYLIFGNAMTSYFVTAICSPSCMNGGRCIGPDECSCLLGWAGSFCETSKFLLCAKAGN